MFSAEFLLTSLIVVLIPGTGVIFTIATGVGQGRRASIAAAFGCTLGIVPHLLATIVGLAAILHASALAFQLLKFAGVAYLLYLAAMMWRDKTGFDIRADRSEARVGALIVRGFLINILNPKLSIFFLAFLPQFVNADQGEPVWQMLGLSAVFMAMTFVVFIVYGFIADSFRRAVVDSAVVQNWLQKGFAAAFAALGLRLAFAEK